MRYRFGELFCGAGGMALGASLAGLQPVWGIDINRNACETHRKNLEGDALCADVRTVSFSTLPDVDCLAFGFPCSDFSGLGKRPAFKGKFGGLYKECVRALTEKHPKIFVAENVKLLISLKKGAVLAQIVKDFEAAGYNVYYKVLRFEFLGVPQKRHRVIFIGVRNDINIIPSFPVERDRATPCKECIDRPIPPNCKNNEPYPISERARKIFPFIRQGGNYKTASKESELPNIHCTGNYATSKYRRLCENEPATTVVGSAFEENQVHYKENRWLTNREAARLQTFPDNFEFVGHRDQVHDQIGMAVPPLGIKLVFENVKKLLDQNKEDR